MVSRNDVLCGEELPMETNGTCQRRICLMAALFSSSLFSSPFFSLFLKHLHSRRNFAISREVDKVDGIKKGSSSLKTIRFIRNLGEKKDRGIGLLTISSIGHSYKFVEDMIGIGSKEDLRETRLECVSSLWREQEQAWCMYGGEREIV